MDSAKKFVTEAAESFKEFWTKADDEDRIAAAIFGPIAILVAILIMVGIVALLTDLFIKAVPVIVAGGVGWLLWSKFGGKFRKQ